MAFFLILAGMICCDLIVAAWMYRRAPSRPAALALLLFALVPIGQIAWMLIDRPSSLRAHEWVPMPLTAISYLWSLIVAPATAIALGIAFLVRRALPRPPPKPPDISRRRLLAASVAFVPPLAAGATLAVSLPRLGDFRVRRLNLPIKGLPPGLEGLTIAHLSDLHHGKFTKPADVSRAVDVTNALGADLVVFTGDLIDLSITDLPAALEALSRIRAPGGLFACEGNHDLIDDGLMFRKAVRDAGVALLLDDASTISLRGERVRLHGLTWARDQAGRRETVTRARDLMRQDAFPILLSHHPHAFDEAAGFPLTLSGHTHGGMLMLNERLGAGPILYRYWSGPYTRDGRSLVVSNGIGNWFPLRTHAPAEILQLTLTRGA